MLDLLLLSVGQLCLSGSDISDCNSQSEGCHGEQHQWPVWKHHPPLQKLLGKFQ